MHRSRFPLRAFGPAVALAGRVIVALPAPRARAQQAAKPAEAAPPAKRTPAEAITFAAARREEWRKARTSIYFNDFGEINRYRRANAQLKNWHILRKLRCCPWRAGQLAKAIHVLQVREA